MALGAGERVLYARQLLLTELRDDAHERVLETRTAVEGSPAPRALAVFEDYAARAGLGVRPGSGPALSVRLPSEAELLRHAGSRERKAAVAALAGALAAASAVLRAAGADVPEDSSSLLSVVSEDVS
jgi:hypothetical protein